MAQPPVERREVIVTEEPVVTHRRRQVVRDPGHEQRVAAAKLIQFIWLLFGILDTLFAIRFVLKLINANPNNGFANLIYDVTGVFLAPFSGLVENLTSGDAVIEVNTLIAIVVYSLVGWVIARLIWIVLYRPSERVVHTYEERD
jgi:hypothetical protein